MDLALSHALKAYHAGEVPVGAVIVHENKVIATGKNTKETFKDPTGHAEVNAIRTAAKELNDWRLTQCTLYVTLEPCIMCAGAILAARIPKVVFGAWDEKAGAAGSQFDLLRERRLNHQVEVVSGIQEKECKELLDRFFKESR
ncbi:MAG: tRNA adenosine(34) deaminase TadA [Micrococcaceae bacterium]